MTWGYEVCSQKSKPMHMNISRGKCTMGVNRLCAEEYSQCNWGRIQTRLGFPRDSCSIPSVVREFKTVLLNFVFDFSITLKTDHADT